MNRACPPPGSRRIRRFLALGRNGYLVVQSNGVHVRTRRRHYVWYRRGFWVPLSGRKVPEGRFGRFWIEVVR